MARPSARGAQVSFDHDRPEMIARGNCHCSHGPELTETSGCTSEPIGTESRTARPPNSPPPPNGPRSGAAIIGIGARTRLGIARATVAARRARDALITPLALGDGPFFAAFFGAAGQPARPVSQSPDRPAPLQPRSRGGGPTGADPLALGAAHRHWSRFDGAVARRHPAVPKRGIAEINRAVVGGRARSGKRGRPATHLPSKYRLRTRPCRPRTDAAAVRSWQTRRGGGGGSPGRGIVDARQHQRIVGGGTMGGCSTRVPPIPAIPPMTRKSSANSHLWRKPGVGRKITKLG